MSGLYAGTEITPAPLPPLLLDDQRTRQAMPALHTLALTLICLIWAGNFIAAASAVQYLSGLEFTLLRFVVVLALLLPWIRRPVSGQWFNLTMACLGMGALHFGLVFMALDRSVDIASIAILMQVYVPLTTLLAVIMLKERIGWRTSSGISLAFLGVLIVGLDPLVLTQLDVVLLVLASAFCLALGTIFMRRIQGVGMLSFQAWNALLSIFPLAFAGWLLEPGFLNDPAKVFQTSAWKGLLYSAIGASIIGHGLFYWLIQRHEVNRITPYLLTVPILAVGLSIWLWGDRPGPRLLVGGGLVILGVLWITLRARNRGRVITETP